MSQIPKYGDGRSISVGLLGGSFNPAHAGHLQLARYALTHLRLDQVWLMVSPGNPLKSRAGMAPFPDRLATARALADGRRIIATDIEARLGKRYTVETVSLLRLRFPRVRFVWLMGADGLASLTRWRRWRDLALIVPMAIVPRPGSNRTALSGQATHALRHLRVPARQGPVLSRRKGGVWAFLPAPQNGISATALRDSGHYPPALSRTN
ncbi:nicotinate-nucleotide adenylyltransferase [Swaminathania salitolerans]|uniref:Probable nicotinate-nucleotide adenylyltransferase n=1 Tax=Swaminathania salitolerans TaxID=182838 RepID=A0A511BTJ2_9PROT|nr:nicotinate-nucleotide adenylyltransferase [Swaminathania salitolerans]GBQ12483.1 nicotinic acid mononucleotide adenylyltransferase [Swaminathania salitolerans LMG 21291]GEL02864.1 putative nicotinate-nucleotide adenylyltransferase [Swaminathania salitolerans]